MMTGIPESVWAVDLKRGCVTTVRSEDIRLTAHGVCRMDTDGDAWPIWLIMDWDFTPEFENL